MAQMILKKPKQEEINEIKSFIIRKCSDRIKNLLFEAIESSRFDRIFNSRCEGRCKING